jgi:hypothetical protein
MNNYSSLRTTALSWRGGLRDPVTRRAMLWRDRKHLVAHQCQTGQRLGPKRSVVPGPPLWGLCVGLRTQSQKINCYETMEEAKTYTRLYLQSRRRSRRRKTTITITISFSRTLLHLGSYLAVRAGLDYNSKGRFHQVRCNAST